MVIPLEFLSLSGTMIWTYGLGVVSVVIVVQGMGVISIAGVIEICFSTSYDGWLDGTRTKWIY